MRSVTNMSDLKPSSCSHFPMERIYLVKNPCNQMCSIVTHERTRRSEKLSVLLFHVQKNQAHECAANGYGEKGAGLDCEGNRHFSFRSYSQGYVGAPGALQEAQGQNRSAVGFRSLNLMKKLKPLVLCCLVSIIAGCAGPVSYTDRAPIPRDRVTKNWAQIEVVSLTALRKDYEIVGECRAHAGSGAVQELKKQAAQLDADAISNPVPSQNGALLYADAIKWK